MLGAIFGLFAIQEANPSVILELEEIFEKVGEMRLGGDKIDTKPQTK